MSRLQQLCAPLSLSPCARSHGGRYLFSNALSGPIPPSLGNLQQVWVMCGAVSLLARLARLI
jgi:hypothetical protein